MNNIKNDYNEIGYLTPSNITYDKKDYNKNDFVFFWGHTPKNKDVIDESCFSQWYPSKFMDDDGCEYLSAEHWMMAEKARLFDDCETLNEILKTIHPREVKKLGRKINNFNQEVWDVYKFRIVCTGNDLKFSQNPDLKDFLISTNNNIIVEASPYDSIWGIGLSVDNANICYPEKWPGENLLGRALMTIRHIYVLTDFLSEEVRREIDTQILNELKIIKESNVSQSQSYT